MSKLSERIQNLTPEQQELLRRRMQREAGQQLQTVPPSAGCRCCRRCTCARSFWFAAEGGLQHLLLFR